MNATEQDPLARVLGDLAEVGRKLVETSESALALLRTGEAECRQPEREPEAKDPMPTTKLSTLFTRREVADLLRIDERTLGRWRADSAMKFPRPIRRSRVLRWRRKDIDDWLEARR